MKNLNKTNIILLILSVGLLLFNQLTIAQLSRMSHSVSMATMKDLSSVDFSTINSTGHTIAALFPVEDIQDTQDAVDMLFPTGTPEYAGVFENKISFDDPVSSLDYLYGEAYPKLAAHISQNSPETWQRFVELGNMPVGLSCEFCCGVGPIGITPDGRSRCGCQHNPALLAIALGLMEFTDYSDAEVMYEVIRWKTLFFPKDMVGLAMTVAGGDTSQLDKLPGMVGGC